MDARQPIPGLNRNESDAAIAVGVFLIGMLVLLCTGLLSLHMLAGLPDDMIYGIAFAMIVFTTVCIGAFWKSNMTPRRPGPPQLEFRNPARRRRRAPARPKQL
ncbi:MAG TPA: hypothetical protein VGK20_00945 [Candidatus Binatia bacterium]